MSYRFDAAGGTRSSQEQAAILGLATQFEKSSFSTIERLVNFPMYVPRQNLTTFLIKYEIFKRILTIHGSIIEVGVGFGGGLMTWAHLSAILESTNHVRRVLGFDTFAGFPSVSEHDTAYPGMMKVDSKDEIEACVSLFDKNRAVGHIPKVELIKGDASQTIPEYVQSHPHLVVSLLYLDADIYEPTLTALHSLRPLMPAGAIIAFDELAMADWPGETTAVKRALDLTTLKIERCSFGSTISFAQL
jgi:hypothetical protein